MGLPGCTSQNRTHFGVWRYGTQFVPNLAVRSQTRNSRHSDTHHYPKPIVSHKLNATKFILIIFRCYIRTVSDTDNKLSEKNKLSQSSYNYIRILHLLQRQKKLNCYLANFTFLINVFFPRKASN